MDFSIGGLNISFGKKSDTTPTTTTIEVREGNVQEQTDVEAIVNAANRRLAPGTGVCGAIFKAAGFDKLEDSVKALYPHGCPCGDAVVTPAFDLEATGVKNIIHAVGPKYADYPADIAARRLRQVYQSIFRRVNELGLKSVAIPAISTGVYGYPADEAAAIAVEEAKAAQQTLNGVRIIFVVWNDKLSGYYNALGIAPAPAPTPVVDDTTPTTPATPDTTTDNG